MPQKSTIESGLFGRLQDKKVTLSMGEFDAMLDCEDPLLGWTCD